MNERDLKLLQHNLTKSAKKAKKYWVRGMVGYTESEQGFYSIESIPVNNHFKNKITTLAELIEDTHSYYNESNQYIIKVENKLTNLTEDYNKYVNNSIERINKLEEDMAKLQQEVKDLAIFNLG